MRRRLVKNKSNKPRPIPASMRLKVPIYRLYLDDLNKKFFDIPRIISLEKAMSPDPPSGSERVFNIAILGANHEVTKLVGESLGAPGNKSDLLFYNRLDASLGQIFTAIDPVTYPEKLKPLLQACYLAEIHIMVIDAETGINAAVGEIMIAMDIFAKRFHTKTVGVIGNITNSNEWRIEEIKTKFPKIAKGTALEQLPFYCLKERADYDQLKKTLVDLGLTIPLQEPEKAPYVKVLIDSCFPVKGVGTVVLGVVKQGLLVAGEMYDLIGGNERSKIIVRSIQKQDRDFKTAVPGDRIGLALKGPKPEDVDRNTYLVSLNAFTLDKKFAGKLTVSPFYKPPEGSISNANTRQYYLIVDLAVTSVKITGGDPLKPGQTGPIELTCEKEIAHEPKHLWGILADFGQFENKLRIIGTFLLE